jgi:hypothetical protein
LLDSAILMPSMSAALRIGLVEWRLAAVKLNSARGWIAFISSAITPWAYMRHSAVEHSAELLHTKGSWTTNVCG